MADIDKTSSVPIHPPAEPGSAAASSERLTTSWWIIWAGLMLWGLVSQILILSEAWRENPFAAVPTVDANVYWEWAEDVAAGRLLRPLPFMSAPLYPYLLGTIRALGGGLLTVYLLQAGLHLATLGLLAYGAARRFGAVVGLLAGALFVLLAEPAFFTGRVLNCTLQLFLVTTLWLALLRAQQRSSLGAWALVGALTGLNCLANPPMLLAIILLGFWVWWQSGWRLRGVTNAAILAGTAVLVISPATFHNYRVSGEFIPVSAQAGITFTQGNVPGADGSYMLIPDISTNRKQQNHDALRLYRQTTGHAGGWNAVNRFFFRGGLRYWRARPGEALHLFFKKLYRFVTNQNVGNIYSPALEIEHGLADWLRVAPLPLPWLILPALVALIALARSPHRYVPELILFGVPLLVVLIFFYSPRYRLPATPMVVVAGALALWQALHWRARRRWLIALVVALAITVQFQSANRASGYDSSTPSAHFHSSLGWALRTAGYFDEAIVHHRKALELDPDFIDAHMSLGTLLLLSGDSDGALEHFRETVRIDPKFVRGYIQIANVHMSRGEVSASITPLRTAHQLAPDDPKMTHTLAWLLATTPNLPPEDRATALNLAGLLVDAGGNQVPTILDLHATALAANGRFTEAVATLEQAITLARRHGEFEMAESLQSRLYLFKAGKPYIEQVSPASRKPGP